MYKSIFFFICIFSLVNVSTLFADPWRAYGGKYFELFGQPIVIRDVQVVKEVIVNGKAHYMYKLIVSRPSYDDGTGVVPWSIVDTRLYYWAAVHGTDRYLSIYDDRPTPQFKYEGRPDLIIIYIPHGLAPCRTEYNIRVGALPYPRVFGYDFRKAIQLYRSDYKLYLDIVMEYSGPLGIPQKYLFEKGKDAIIDGVLSRLVSVYGQELKIEAYAKIPDIVGMTMAQANKKLKMRTLVPRLNQKIYNPDKKLHGRVKNIVGDYNIVDYNRIRANTQISYNLWTSTLSGDQKPQSQPQISYSDEYLESISSDKFLDEQKQSINQSAPQKSFVAFYRIRCSGCAADFAVMLESKFIEKYQNNNKIQVLGRAQTAKEAIRRACNKLTKRRKPHIGLSYEHNGWLLRGVGSRCK